MRGHHVEREDIEAARRWAAELRDRIIHLKERLMKTRTVRKQIKRWARLSGFGPSRFTAGRTKLIVARKPADPWLCYVGPSLGWVELVAASDLPRPTGRPASSNAIVPLRAHLPSRQYRRERTRRHRENLLDQRVLRMKSRSGG